MVKVWLGSHRVWCGVVQGKATFVRVSLSNGTACSPSLRACLVCARVCLCLPRARVTFGQIRLRESTLCRTWQDRE